MVREALPCQSCSTRLRPGEKPKNLARQDLRSVLDTQSVLHCNDCKKSVHEADPSDKCVDNPYWEEMQQRLVAANGDALAAFRQVIDQVYSELQVIKAYKTRTGKTPSFLDSSRLQSKDGYSRAFVEGFVLEFASTPRICCKGSGHHSATELRLDSKPPLAKGIVAMILTDTLRVHKTAITSSSKACVHCETQNRYSVDTTLVLSFSKEVGCSKCIVKWTQGYSSDGGECALIPSLHGRPTTMFVMPNGLVEEGKGNMLHIPFDLLVSFAHSMSKGRYNPSRLQIEKDARKLEEKRIEIHAKMARRWQEKVEAIRSALPDDVPRLTDDEKIAATKAVPAVLDVVSELAMKVHGTRNTLDVLASSNFASVVPNPDGSFTLLTKNEHIAHVARNERALVMDASTGVVLEEGKLYDHHKFDITGKKFDLATMLVQVTEAVKTSRENGICSVLTIQLTKACHYVDAKSVEKGGHTAVWGKGKLIPMEASYYNPGGYSKKTPMGVTHLCLFVDMLGLVSSGKARLCLTGASQAFMNTLSTKAPFTLDFGYWSKLGDKHSLVVKKQQGASRDNLDDTKPAAEPDEKPASLALKPTAKAKSATKSNQTRIDDMLAPASKSTKSASAAKVALRDVDANTITPKPPKKMRPNPPKSKPKTTKLPTPKQLVNKIVVKTGTISLSSVSLERMFARYDDAEFTNNLPSINDANRTQIILVKGSSSGISEKLQRARLERVVIIDEGTFMDMLES